MPNPFERVEQSKRVVFNVSFFPGMDHSFRKLYDQISTLHGQGWKIDRIAACEDSQLTVYLHRSVYAWRAFFDR